MKIFRSILSLFFVVGYTAAYSAIPSGYYNAATGTGQALKTQLFNIIKGHTPLDYGDLWTAYKTTDDVNNAGVYVWDMYSDIPGSTPEPYLYQFVSGDQCGTYNSEGDCYNREHSFPASWFNDGAPMYTDLFQVIPADGYVNNRRSNYPLGVVGSADWTSLNGSKVGTCTYPGYTGKVFEPIDEYKGDFARTYFYMATRYENLIAGWYANSTEANAVLLNNAFLVFESWFLTMLAEWHIADPVSQKEIERNDAVYAIQGNRNPFIDHPEYVNQIWGTGQTTNGKIEAGKPTPSGSLLDYGTVSTSAAKTLQVKTADITGDLTVAVTGTMFSTTTTTITVAQANAGYEITVTFTPTASGTHTGTLTISGGGLNPAFTVNLTGKK